MSNYKKIFCMSVYKIITIITFCVLLMIGSGTIFHAHNSVFMSVLQPAVRIAFLIILIFNFSGCTIVEKIEEKLGLKNDYFEYLNSNDIEQISIQSIRDTGFKFIVTEASAIKEIYSILSRAKVSENKSSLDPDYKFEFDLGDEIKEFNYVVGTEDGNFYNDDNVFSVSKRLDEVIIKNLSFIRKPRDFDYIYYQTILEVLQIANKNQSLKDYNVGVNISGDIDCLKYVFSSDLNKFLAEAKKISPNIELVNNNEPNFDIVITVKNRGYDSSNFKTLITVNNKRESTENKYYVVAVNEFKEWNIDVLENKPSGW